MAHHHHSHDDRQTYYLNQLFTIAVCGALGAVAVMLWYTDRLRLILHPKFFPWVLMGGVTLLVLVVLRAIAVWRSVDEPTHSHDHEHCDHHHGTCDHDHGHNHDHGHAHGIQSAAQTTGVSSGSTTVPPAVPELDPDHEVGHKHSHSFAHEHSHDHEHDHEHGWAPWRYVVLLLPVVLYFLNLPNQGFTADAGGSLNDLAVNAPASVKSTGTVSVSFMNLQQAALTQESRDFYEGKTITLKGQYLGNDPRRFALRRFKIACCGADAVKLDAVIMVNDESTETVDPDRYRNQWVEVTGRVHFFPKPGTNAFITAIILYPTKDEPIKDIVKKIPPPADFYVY